MKRIIISLVFGFLMGPQLVHAEDASGTATISLGSPVDLGTVEIEIAPNRRAIATLRWSPGEIVDPSQPIADGLERRGHSLEIKPIPAGDWAPTGTPVVVSVPQAELSRRRIEPDSPTGAIVWLPEQHTLVVVVADSIGTRLFSRAMEYRVEVFEDSILVVERTDRWPSPRSINCVTPLGEDSRPLITSVERLDAEIVLSIAPWKPTAERPTNPTPTVRARFSPDFKQVIAVEPIPTDPPPGDPE